MNQPSEVSDWMHALSDVLTGRVCIVGIGNRQRGDDGAGPSLIDRRPQDAPGTWIDAGVVPENYLEPIAKTHPDTILLVDAVLFGGAPGQCQLLETRQVDLPTLSTHAGSLQLLQDYLTNRTAARIYLLAIQPARLSSRVGLSAAVEKTVIELVDLLPKLLACERMTPGSNPT